MQRLRQPEIRRFLSLLGNLSLVQDAEPVDQQVGSILPLAREYGLSAYDAAYLELSLRRAVPLATLEVKLQKAARRAGVTIFAG
ncbi:MAG TPA: type II toxin-antitoxin system VapC family toxin [Bryobacteraceae bacterium]|jgi:predicted nucleic acid-binding protein